MMLVRLYCFFCIILLFSCNENEYPHAFPFPLTLEVSNISTSGVQLNGSIETIGMGQTIEKYGFVWSEDSNPTINDSHVFIDGSIRVGVYSKSLTSDLITNKIYYVRAFVKTSHQIIYGNIISFNSQGSLPPEITGFSISESIDGNQFIIMGKNFSTSLTGNIVKVGNIKLDVLSASDSLLQVLLVPNPLMGEYFISVKVAEKEVFSDEKFRILGPRVISIPKNSGRVGELMIAEGEYFTSAELVQWYGTITKVLSDQQFEFYVDSHQNEVPLVEKLTLQSYILGSDPNTGKESVYPDDFTIINSWNEIDIQGPYVGVGYTSEVIEDKVLCVGGNTLVEYNTSQHTWTNKASFPGPYRTNGASFLFNDKVYYGFGDDGSGNHFNDLWMYDREVDSWSYIGYSPMAARSKPEVFVIEDKAYFGFGYSISGPINYIKDLWEYDIIDNSWTERSVPFQGNEEIRTSFAIGGKGYIINATDSELWQFDPVSNSWQAKARYPQRPGHERAMVSSGGVFVVSDDLGWGNLYGKLTHIYQYDPQSDYWRPRQTLRRESYAGSYRFSQYVNGKIYYGKDDLWELSFE